MPWQNKGANIQDWPDRQKELQSATKMANMGPTNQSYATDAIEIIPQHHFEVAPQHFQMHTSSSIAGGDGWHRDGTDVIVI
jgi:preprotein translocase subunit SecD